jgi:threonine/homoserine/homoserine lactone efflux protein
VTPGPNNTMLTASGVNFGLTRSLPHMLGISVGFPLMILATGLGAGTVLSETPELLRVVKWVGIAYLLWLAWGVATAAAPVQDSDVGETRPRGKPLTLLQAAGFQWVNPKAWIIVASIVATYSGDGTIGEIAIVALVFAVVSLFSTVLWAGFGTAIGALVQKPTYRRAINWGLAAVLVLSVIPMALSDF